MRKSLATLCIVANLWAVFIFSSNVIAYGAPDLPPPNRSQSVTPFTPIHLCNWHLKNRSYSSWGTASILPLLNDGSPGPGYDSFNPGIIMAQNAQMSAAHLNPMVSWWGPNDSSGDEFLDLYLSIPGPQLGILYEVTSRLIKGDDGWYDMDDPRNAKTFLDDIAHINLRYWSNPAYADRWARIDGKPVFFIWLSHAFKGNFRAVSTQSRQMASYYLIGSDFNPLDYIRADGEQVIAGMDAVSAYGVYSPPATLQHGGFIDEGFVQQYERNVDAWLAWLPIHAPGTKLLLPFSFAFDDTKVIPIRGNPVLATRPEDAPMWVARVRALEQKALNECKPILPGTMIVSWNENFEGTSIEPTDRWGDLWLRLVQESLTAPITYTSTCSQ